MMWALFAQAASTTDPLAWVGQLSAPALTGVLLYYLVTKALPELQAKFHDALEKERQSRERIAEKTFEEHRDAVTKIIQRDEVRTDKIMGKLEELPARLKCGP